MKNGVTRGGASSTARKTSSVVAVLFRKELRDQLLVSAIVTVLLVATIGLIVFTYPILKNVPEFQNIARTAPELKDFGDIAGQISRMLGDYSYYLWSQWFPKNLVQIAAIFAIILGVMAFANEYAARTFEYLLTRPVRRRDVFVAKAGARLLIIAAVVYGTSALYVTVGYLADSDALERVNVGGFVAAATGVFLLCALAFAIAVALVVRMRKALSALLASIGTILVTSTALSLLESKLPRALRLNEQLLGQRVFEEATLAWEPVLVVGTATAVLLWSGWSVFRGQDV
jgi:ABC-type transport system involved in multi-copper enzyme maturation permease subunit